MGTASLIIVSYKSQWLVAQFSSLDGYPKGQGKVIADFVSKPDNLKKLKAAPDEDKVYYLGNEAEGDGSI